MVAMVEGSGAGEMAETAEEVKAGSGVAEDWGAAGMAGTRFAAAWVEATVNSSSSTDG